MDKTEMEKLMDRYKREMIEFRRRNGEMLYETADEKERGMMDASMGRNSYERDRSDPLKSNMPQEESAVQEKQPEAVRAQVNAAPMQEPTVRMTTDGIVDGTAMLRERCAGISSNSSATAEQRQRCREISDFLARNAENGILRIETSASDRTFGVGSARVMIFLPLESGNVMIFDGLTDISGLTDRVRLPAPNRELSMSPRGENRALPYSEYSVYVEHPSYVRAVFSNVPVFSGIESIQPVQMLAKVAGVNEPEPIAVDESSTNTL